MEDIEYNTHVRDCVTGKGNISEAMFNTLIAIQDAGLRHPAGPLLRCLIEYSKEPEVAAEYVKERMDAGEASQIVADWAYIIECITSQGTEWDPVPKSARKSITRRDHGECCITGLKGSLWDPLVVLPVLPVPTGWFVNPDNEEKDRIAKMLTVFLGQKLHDFWLGYAERPGKQPSRHFWAWDSHWLVKKSAAKAFARGMVMLERCERMEDFGVEYMVYPNQILGTERQIKGRFWFPTLLGSRSWRLEQEFLETHARLSMSMRYLEIAKEIAPEILRHDGASQKDIVPVDSTPLKPSAPEARRHTVWPFVTALFTGLFLTIWLLLPVRFRSAVYWAMERIGNKFAQYGLFDCANRPRHFQVLPFGLLLNIEASSEPVDNYENEFRALQLIRQHTSIPVPRPLDIVPGPAFHLPHKERIFLPLESQTIRFMLTTRVPGYQLLKCLPFMTDRHIQELALQMRQYISELRSIPNKASPDMAICNTLGGPVAFLRPHRLYEEIAGYGDAYAQIEGIFADEDAFSQTLRFPDHPGRHGHKIVFSHGCLAPKNIYVDRYLREDGTSGWKITGIVNWRRSGWFPDYWDYTRGLFEVSLLNPRLRTGQYYVTDDSRLRYEEFFLDAVFEVHESKDYSAEWDVEERSWQLEKEEEPAWMQERMKKHEASRQKEADKKTTGSSGTESSSCSSSSSSSDSSTVKERLSETMGIRDSCWQH